MDWTRIVNGRVRESAAGRARFEKPGADTLIWRADAPSMNPSLPRDYLERMKLDDPIGYRQEVLAEFVHGVSTLLDR
jgi:hypothetical protein